MDLCRSAGASLPRQHEFLQHQRLERHANDGNGADGDATNTTTPSDTPTNTATPSATSAAPARQTGRSSPLAPPAAGPTPSAPPTATARPAAARPARGHDRIKLAANYSLTEEPPDITSPVTVDGGGYTLSSGGHYRPFDLSGADLTILNLTITGGQCRRRSWRGDPRLGLGRQAGQRHHQRQQKRQ